MNKERELRERVAVQEPFAGLMSHLISINSPVCLFIEEMFIGCLLYVKDTQIFQRDGPCFLRAYNLSVEDIYIANKQKIDISNLAWFHS